MTTSLYCQTYHSPFGRLGVVVDDDSAVALISFLDAGGEPEIEALASRRRARIEHDSSRTADVIRELEEYFAGRRSSFSVLLAPSGTDFQHAVWRAVSAIPFAATSTYGRIAVEVGRPKASRAVGRANATNPIPIIVPCHRVVGSDGTLTGFGGGLDLKARLLAHEKGLKAPAVVATAG